MTCRLHGKHRVWGGGADDEGYRTYGITWIVNCGRKDGPANVMQTPGLPLPGALWQFEDDIDVWAFCYPWMEVEHLAQKEGDPSEWWAVKQKFSTKPMKRCQDERVENPILEPPKISGGHSRYTHEATHDRHGRMILTSSLERYKGNDVEFDRNRPTFKMEQNVATLGQDVYVPMVDTVNDSPIWGFNERCVKLSTAYFERNVYGKCGYYYTRHFEFEVNHASFDKILPDEGTRVLSGHWDIREKTSVGVGYGCKITIRAANAGGSLTFVTLAEDPSDTTKVLGGAGFLPSTADMQLKLFGGGGAGGIVYGTSDADGAIISVRLENAGDPGFPFGLGSGYSTSPKYLPNGFNYVGRYRSIPVVQKSNVAILTTTTVSGTSTVPSPIATITLVSGGFGYPANSTIRLAIHPKDENGESGICNAVTNSSGIVTSVSLKEPGINYIPDLSAETSFSQNCWVLDPVNGVEPDRFNAQHFIKYVDQKGNPTKVALDGTGRPASSSMFNNNTFRLTGDPAFQKVEYYPESNFFLLGIPLEF